MVVRATDALYISRRSSSMHSFERDHLLGVVVDEGEIRDVIVLLCENEWWMWLRMCNVQCAMWRRKRSE